MSELFRHTEVCRPYDCVCTLGNDWENTYEFGVKRERSRIIDVIRKNVGDDCGEGLTIPDEDNFQCVLNLSELISLIGGSDES